MTARRGERGCSSSRWVTSDAADIFHFLSKETTQQTIHLYSLHTTFTEKPVVLSHEIISVSIPLFVSLAWHAQLKNFFKRNYSAQGHQIAKMFTFYGGF